MLSCPFMTFNISFSVSAISVSNISLIRSMLRLTARLLVGRQSSLLSAVISCLRYSTSISRWRANWRSSYRASSGNVLYFSLSGYLSPKSLSSAVFENPEFGKIRTLTDEIGEPLFCAKDVCDVLGYKRARCAVAQLVNPWGCVISLWRTPFYFLPFHRYEIFKKHFYLQQSPNFHKLGALPFRKRFVSFLYKTKMISLAQGN